ncbi:MAG: DNA polymerase IV [Chloroflexi bacterium]|nr:DNA polymerase IV [Chloroflexota bacterium]
MATGPDQRAGGAAGRGDRGAAPRPALPACLTSAASGGADRAVPGDRGRPPRRIAHFDLDQFFVAVERARDSSLAGKPVIVGYPGPRGVVSTASYEARAFGAHSAQPMAEALRLCPQAVVIAPQRRRYQAASEQFHRILSAHVPIVQPGGLDEAYADLTGVEAGDPEGPRRVAEGVRSDVSDQIQVRVSVCIAGGRTTAKVGSDKVKPDGLLEIPPGGDAAFLAPLPIRVLPSVGPQFAGQLKRAGVETIGDAAALSKQWLAEQFGRRGIVLSDRARGVDPTPVTGGSAPAKQVSRETTFDADITAKSHMRQVVGQLAASVAADLRSGGRRARTITLKLRWSDFSTITRSQTLPQPVYDTEAVAAAADRLLRRVIAGAPGRAVRLLGISAGNLETPLRQLEMESISGADRSDRQRRRAERRDAALDAIRRRFGPRALRRGLAREED